MSKPLYTTEILRLAASTARFSRLEAPAATAEKRSPVCGSRVTVDVNLDASGAVSAVGQEVRACALGQASAALLENNIIGKSAEDLISARDSLKSWLSGRSISPGEWPGLFIFEPALSHTARHPAILLAFEAAAEAAQKAQG